MANIKGRFLGMYADLEYGFMEVMNGTKKVFEKDYNSAEEAIKATKCILHLKKRYSKNNETACQTIIARRENHITIVRQA